jgi:hypothetical protein
MSLFSHFDAYKQIVYHVALLINASTFDAPRIMQHLDIDTKEEKGLCSII